MYQNNIIPFIIFIHYIFAENIYSTSCSGNTNLLSPSAAPSYQPNRDAETGPTETTTTYQTSIQVTPGKVQQAPSVQYPDTSQELPSPKSQPQTSDVSCPQELGTLPHGCFVAPETDCNCYNSLTRANYKAYFGYTNQVANGETSSGFDIVLKLLDVNYKT